MARSLVYGSTKTWKAVASTAFRQWRADSHCNQLHGYALTICATFEADELDDRNWVVDFGELRTFKQWIEQQFDHVTLVAKDDPAIDWFRKAHSLGWMTLKEVDATGCEAIAQLVFYQLEEWLNSNEYTPRVRLVKLEVSEHEGNSAYVRRRNFGERLQPELGE